MSKEYIQLHNEYGAALAKSKAGDKAASADKARIMGQIRQVERESARTGVVLNPVMKRGQITVQTTQTSSRRSLQEEYVRKFDDKIPVDLARAGEEPQRSTLREYHAKRLLARS